MAITASSRRAGRVNNKTKLLVVRGSEKVDLGQAETIVWDDPSSASGEPAKHQHVGAKGVESGEFLEHHLQAALSSASLLHSRPAKASSPTPGSSRPSTRPSDGTHATLNYHIPTPDATGLVESADHAKLYQTQVYHEPHGYIRFSDTVEEASGGQGGLGYCMDDEDELWLKNFNSKAEGSSATSPLRETKGENTMGPPTSSGRPRREKGKEKDASHPPVPLFISEDSFEFVMGVFEKHADDKTPTLDMNLSLLPTFANIEHLFSSPLEPSFFPNFELPKDIPPLKELTRQARCIYPHWKDRRLQRKGKSILPSLNYDDSNDGDPYVCFRRRDMRQTRKARRTDNFSVEKMQKLQLELRSAHQLVQLVQRREAEKKVSYKVDKEVWEAKWKLFETKRRWPSLGLTREEEEIITGRQSRESAMMNGTVNAAMLGGREALQAQRENLPSSMRRKTFDRNDERDKRDRGQTEAQRLAEKAMAFSGGKSYAPDALKERMMALKQKLEDEISKRKIADADWDDMTDSSYQPLPPGHGSHAFRPVTMLDPQLAASFARNTYDDDRSCCQPLALRLRRGRGGILRLDRYGPLAHTRRANTDSPSKLTDSLLPETKDSQLFASRRPKSIDEVDDNVPMLDEDAASAAETQRLRNNFRYDVDNGGAVGIGMGMSDNEDRLVIDDLDPKYVRNRIGLLREEDVEKLRPDMKQLAAALQNLDTPEEMPLSPVFVRPQIQPPNPQVMAQLQQQQFIQQQQMEHFQRYQMMAQQQALAAQQQAALAQAQAQAQAAAQAQAQQNAMAQRGASSDGAAGSPSVNGSAPPNGQSGKPAINRLPSQNGQNGANGSSNGVQPNPSRRASISPTNSLQKQFNGSPQMMNGMMIPSGTKGNFLPPQQGTNGHHLDAQMQQRILAARAIAAQQAQNAAQAQINGVTEDGDNGSPAPTLQITAEHIELARLAQQAGFGNNIAGFMEARNKARLLTLAKQQQAAQNQANGNAPSPVGNPNGNGGGNGQQGNQGQFNSPSPAQMQLKLPAHAAARLGAAQGGQGQRAS